MEVRERVNELISGYLEQNGIELIAGNADAGVLNRELDHARVMRRHSDIDLPARGCVENRVFEQVADDLFERSGVAPDTLQRTLSDGNAQVGALGKRSVNLHDRLNELGKIDRRKRHTARTREVR